MVDVEYLLTGQVHFNPRAHQVILGVKIILGNEHRCECLRLRGTDRTQLNT
jgi:hypothetical protein